MINGGAVRLVIKLIVFKKTRLLQLNACLIPREVYHTRRMQRVFCVRFSADSTYVLSGSDETNIR